MLGAEMLHERKPFRPRLVPKPNHTCEAIIEHQGALQTSAHFGKLPGNLWLLLEDELAARDANVDPVDCAAESLAGTFADFRCFVRHNLLIFRGFDDCRRQGMLGIAFEARSQA